MIIYKAINKKNNMFYIGQTTKTLKKRKKEYEYKLNCVDFYFYRAMRKYGIDNFMWKTLRTCRNKTELDKWEKYYIQKYQSKYPSGYNMTDGGEGTPNRIVQDETRHKLRIANLGKRASKETRKKLSDSHMGNPNPNKGKEFSQKWRENLSKAHKGQDLSHLSPYQFKKGNISWCKGIKLNKTQRARLNMEGLKLGNKARWDKVRESKKEADV